MKHPPFTHQGGAYPQSPADPDIINLGLGQPTPALLPMAAIATAAAARLNEGADRLVLQYGFPAGYRGFREDLAAFLTEAYRYPVGADQLAVTAGTSVALSLVSQVLANPGDTVVTGDPTYFLAQGIWAGHALQLVGIPTDEEGLDVEQLERRLAAGLAPRFVYCIPSFHNPTSVTLSVERARHLVALAERYDFVVVADEPYPLLHFGEPPPCLMSFDEGRGRVLSLGSMSKILAPGLRLGWAHGAPSLIAKLASHGALKSGGCANPVIASIVHGTLENGFLRSHVRQLRQVLGRRARALAGALGERLGAPIATPTGGYFLWLDLGPGFDTSRLLDEARATVRFTPGSRCAVERDLETCLRLSFAFYEEDELVLGAERLARAIAAHR